MKNCKQAFAKTRETLGEDYEYLADQIESVFADTEHRRGSRLMHCTELCRFAQCVAEDLREGLLGYSPNGPNFGAIEHPDSLLYYTQGVDGRWYVACNGKWDRLHEFYSLEVWDFQIPLLLRSGQNDNTFGKQRDIIPFRKSA